MSRKMHAVLTAALALHDVVHIKVALAVLIQAGPTQAISKDCWSGGAGEAFDGNPYKCGVHAICLHGI